MYRPEGISAEKVLEDFGEITSFTKNTDLINAGMDAMLEGLRKFPYGGYRTTNQAPDGIERNGTLVFIPDDTL